MSSSLSQKIISLVTLDMFEVEYLPEGLYLSDYNKF